jgi:hypothetical protein
MPKRSNEFQKLVFLLKQYAAPAGATVTESKFLIDKSIGKEQEVDVCIEFVVAGIPFLISIECTEESRPATKEWVSEMKGKHGDLPTNKLALASRSGFTDQALNKARFHGIDTISLDVLQDDSAERVIKQALSYKVWSLTPTKVTVRVAAHATDKRLPAEAVSIVDDYRIFNEAGEEIGIARTLVHDLLRSQKSSEHIFKHGKPHHKKFSLTERLPTDINGGRIYLRKDFSDFAVLRRMEKVTISGTLIVTVGALELEHARLQETTIAWGTIEYLGNAMLVIAAKDQASPLTFLSGPVGNSLNTTVPTTIPVRTTVNVEAKVLAVDADGSGKSFIITLDCGRPFKKAVGYLSATRVDPSLSRAAKGLFILRVSEQPTIKVGDTVPIEIEPA